MYITTVYTIYLNYATYYYELHYMRQQWSRYFDYSLCACVDGGLCTYYLINILERDKENKFILDNISMIC